MKKLLEQGFKKIGIWKKNKKEISFELNDFNDSKNIIFAFVKDSTVLYIGSTPINFEIFLQTFINPSSVDLEKTAIKKSLMKDLEKNEIAIYGLKNSKFFGLMKRFSPIEISELITELNPSWNSDNLKDRMKNIVGRDRTAVGDSEKLKEKAEKENKETKKVKVEKEKKKAESYIFILGKSYYERGFFNLKTAYSHYVGEDKTDLEIVLVGKDKKEQTIRGRINRTANSSKTARVIGNKALRVWFKENAEINCELKVTFINKKKIKLEIA